MTSPKMLVPSRQTLDKYGFGHGPARLAKTPAGDWKALFRRQGGTCGVCHEVPASGRLVVDHEHVPGWKWMPPEERRIYVRGLCCTLCNHFVLTRYADAEKHRQAARYLERHEKQKARSGL